MPHDVIHAALYSEYRSAVFAFKKKNKNYWITNTLSARKLLPKCVYVVDSGKDAVIAIEMHIVHCKLLRIVKYAIHYICIRHSFDWNSFEINYLPEKSNGRLDAINLNRHLKTVESDKWPISEEARSQLLKIFAQRMRPGKRRTAEKQQQAKLMK